MIPLMIIIIVVVVDVGPPSIVVREYREKEEQKHCVTDPLLQD